MFQVAVAIGRNMLSLSVYIVVGARLLSCTSIQIACSFQLLFKFQIALLELCFVNVIRELCKISVMLLNQNEQSLELSSSLAGESCSTRDYSHTSRYF